MQLVSVVVGDLAQRGSKLVGTGSVWQAYQGKSVALSSDGSTLASGSIKSEMWIFTRSGVTWSQQGTKVVGGSLSVALSSDGNTLAGGDAWGAVWIFTRSGTTWSQQGTKLVGTGMTGSSSQGSSVALSSDGNTLASGGSYDNALSTGDVGDGAVWIFTLTPTSSPSLTPTNSPSRAPTQSHPSKSPTPPTASPSNKPTFQPTTRPSPQPTLPSLSPTVRPTESPSTLPTIPPFVSSSAQLSTTTLGAILGLVGAIGLVLCGGIIVFVFARKKRMRVLQATPSTDVFLTHEWGQDMMHSNHSRVSMVNDGLKSRGIRTWFDEDRLAGDIISQITAGIEKTQVVIVFLTKRYMDKVNQTSGQTDYCRMEFRYAQRTKTVDRMIVVVMEPGMRDTTQWNGVFGALLGGQIYIDFSSQENLEMTVDQIVTRLHEILNISVSSTPEAMKDVPLAIEASMASIVDQDRSVVKTEMFDMVTWLHEKGLDELVGVFELNGIDSKEALAGLRGQGDAKIIASILGVKLGIALKLFNALSHV